MLLNFVKLGGLQLSKVTISWMGILLRGNFPGGNDPWLEFSGWELPWVGIFLGENFLGGNHPGGNFPSGSYHVTVNSGSFYNYIPHFSSERSN